VKSSEHLHRQIETIADEWRSARPERQTRRILDQTDFDRLRKVGLLGAIAPVDQGGLWVDATQSARTFCELYRCLAGGDPSVALVSAMHPAVVSYWLAVPDDSQPDWTEQRTAVLASAMAGEQWGTITSEPGSGGDLAKTKATAVPADEPSFLTGQGYLVSGDKHFGSGSGVTHRMVTTALPEGDTEPTIFVLDVTDSPWESGDGFTMIAEWDGMGMAATQSHAMRLDGAPAIRLAWNGDLATITTAAAPFIATLFTAVILGVLDEAIRIARPQVKARAEGFRAFEQVEWARAEQDHWLAVQAYEGALRAIETGHPPATLHAALRAKQSVADLAEATLLRLTRVLGGGTFSRRSPFAYWFEDVRALGFLRPPWGLAYDMLFFTSLDDPSA
jgi:alkylation response protein AidB-like acyl-CoA dehydrogenase